MPFYPQSLLSLCFSKLERSFNANKEGVSQRCKKTCWWDDVLWAVTWSAVCKGFPGGSDGKGSVCNEGDPGSISGCGRSPGEGNGYPLQCSCLGNPVDSQEVGLNWVTNTFTFTFVAGRGKEVALSSQKDLSPSLARDLPHPTFLDEWERTLPPGSQLVPRNLKLASPQQTWLSVHIWTAGIVNKRSGFCLMFLLCLYLCDSEAADSCGLGELKRNFPLTFFFFHF